MASNYPRITEVPTGDNLVFYLDEDCSDASDCIGELIDYHDGRDVEISAGTIIYIAEKAHPSTSDFLPDFDDIIDRMADAAWDSGSEHAEDFPEVNDTDAAKRELESLLEAWADKYVQAPRWYLCKNVREYAITKADIDAALEDRPNG